MKTAKQILLERGILVYYKRSLGVPSRLDFNLSRDGHIDSMNQILDAMHEYAQQFSESHLAVPDKFTRENIIS